VRYLYTVTLVDVLYSCRAVTVPVNLVSRKQRHTIQRLAAWMAEAFNVIWGSTVKTKIRMKQGTDVFTYIIVNFRGRCFVQNTSSFYKNWVMTFFKTLFFRITLAKIAQNCDHNIDTRSLWLKISTFKFWILNRYKFLNLGRCHFPDKLVN
jgi:hypothetical protein